MAAAWFAVSTVLAVNLTTSPMGAMHAPFYFSICCLLAPKTKIQFGLTALGAVGWYYVEPVLFWNVPYDLAALCDFTDLYYNFAGLGLYALTHKFLNSSWA
jgi:hypothetical protein